MQTGGNRDHRDTQPAARCDAGETRTPSVATFGPFERDDLDEHGKRKPVPAIPWEPPQGHYYVQPEAEAKAEADRLERPKKVARQRDRIAELKGRIANLDEKIKAAGDKGMLGTTLTVIRTERASDLADAETRLAELER